jgi:hypothetical protein
MLIPPYPLKCTRAGIRVTSKTPNIQPDICDGQPKDGVQKLRRASHAKLLAGKPAKIKVGKSWYARQTLTPISFRDRCSNSAYQMRTPTAGNRRGLKIEDIMKAKGPSMFFRIKGGRGSVKLKRCMSQGQTFLLQFLRIKPFLYRNQHSSPQRSALSLFS